MTIDEGVAFAVAGKPPPQPAQAAQTRPHAVLTRRQLEIARLVANGLSNRQIAGPAVLVRTDRGNPHHQHPQQAGPQLQDPDQPLDRRPERASADHGWGTTIASSAAPADPVGRRPGGTRDSAERRNPGAQAQQPPRVSTSG